MKFFIKEWDIWGGKWLEVSREVWLQTYRDRTEILRELEEQ